MSNVFNEMMQRTGRESSTNPGGRPMHDYWNEFEKITLNREVFDLFKRCDEHRKDPNGGSSVSIVINIISEHKLLGLNNSYLHKRIYRKTCKIGSQSDEELIPLDDNDCVEVVS